MAEPTKSHFKAAVRVLKYLKSCPGRGLLFRRDSPIQLLAFSDADWGSCIDSRRSVTGYFFFLEALLFLGRQRNKIQFLNLPQKLSIGPLLPPLMSCSGSLT